MNKPWDEEFEVWRNTFLDSQAKDAEFSKLSKAWMQKAVDNKFSYQFDWMGVPIIQMPGDLVMFQEIVWKTRPDLILKLELPVVDHLFFGPLCRNSVE